MSTTTLDQLRDAAMQATVAREAAGRDMEGRKGLGWNAARERFVNASRHECHAWAEWRAAESEAALAAAV